jgi:hypothetical protein
MLFWRSAYIVSDSHEYVVSVTDESCDIFTVESVLAAKPNFGSH